MSDYHENRYEDAMQSDARSDRCPHCGWTPDEQDALSNERKELKEMLRRVVDESVSEWPPTPEGREHVERVFSDARRLLAKIGSNE